MPFDATSIIAERYARALFDLAREQGGDASLATVAADLREVKAALAGQEEFAALAASPVISSPRKAQAVEALLKSAGASPLISRFFSLLARNRRLCATDAIVDAFERLLREYNGEELAEVQSAKPLEEKEYAAIAETLSRISGKRVRVQPSVDASLLGGFRVRMGGRSIDYTLDTQLSRLSRTLQAA